MPDIALFVEDFAHRQVIGALVRRIAGDLGLDVRLEWRNVRHGYGRVVREFNDYLRDLTRQVGPLPDLIVVATDANCKGLNERTREMETRDAPAPLILAIPDPHIERWLLLDGAAFKAVFGRGCDAPDQKCDRGRYKRRLVESIFAAGVTPILGGLEFAEDIVQCMDLDRAEQADDSLNGSPGASAPPFGFGNHDPGVPMFLREAWLFFSMNSGAGRFAKIAQELAPVCEGRSKDSPS